MIEVITKDYEEKPLFNLLKIEDFISPTHPIIVLSKEIDWRKIEVTLSSLYSDIGRKAVSIKRLSGLLILKYIYNYSDASVVENWSQNLYYQAFTGEDYFNKELPCDPSTLTHFRKRIGVEGAELIFSESVRIHKGKVLEDYCFIDTTVQPKNITFPTDSKLILGAIEHIKSYCEFLEMKISKPYTREIKKLKNQINFGKNVIDNTTKEDAIERLREIANDLLRTFERQLPEGAIASYRVRNLLMILNKVINQRKTEKNKIYSIHEPDVVCIAKGKDNVKYEFGSKAAFLLSRRKGIILGALSCKGNPYDGDTLAPVIKQVSSIHNGYKPKSITGDRGFRGRSVVKGVTVITPYDLLEEQSPNELKKLKNLVKERTCIEPIIGHLKADHRLGRNFLKGILGDQMNTTLSAAAFNFKKFANINTKHKTTIPGSLSLFQKKRRKVPGLPLWKPNPNSLF